MTAKFYRIEVEAKVKLDELNSKLQTLYLEAAKTLMKSLDGSGKVNTISGFLPDQMMIPDAFDKDLTT